MADFYEAFPGKYTLWGNKVCEVVDKEKVVGVLQTPSGLVIPGLPQVLGI